MLKEYFLVNTREQYLSKPTLNQFEIPSNGWYRSGQTDFDTGTGFWLGVASNGIAKFSIGNSAGNKMTWNGSSLDIVGNITATTGTIGGFTIGATTISATNLTLDSSGQRISLGSGNDIIIADADDATYRLWIGHATAGSAPFRVEKDGSVTATDITITGGSVLASLLSGVIAQANLDVSNRGWVQTCAFTVTDADTVTWGSGTFTDANGTAYSIGAGNTGNMAAKTYIYLDTGVSTTAYQTTTTATTAVGAGKVIVAIAQNNTTEATFQVLDGQGGQNIDATSIVAGSITANEIAASTITAGKLSVATLSAITADLGSITAGTIALASSGHIRSGQTAYNTGTGFWLGIDSGTPKFSLGSSSSGLTWDGTSLTVQGEIYSNETVLNGKRLVLSVSGTTAIPDIVWSADGDFYALGIDNADSDALKLTTTSSAGTGPTVLTIRQATSVRWDTETFTIDSSLGTFVTTGDTLSLTGDDEPLVIGLYNSSNGANDNTTLELNQNSSSNDPRIWLRVNSTTDWCIGVDNSDSDIFKIGTSTTVGTNTRFSMTTAGDATFTGSMFFTGTNQVFGSSTSYATGSLTPRVQVHGTDGSGANNTTYRWQAATGGAQISMAHSRGAVGTHTVLQADDVFGAMVGFGSDGTGFISGASIRYVCDGTPGTNDMPGRIEFLTTADGASAPTERGRIDKAGNWIINTAAISTSATDGFLYVPSCAGTPTGTPTTYTGRVPIVVDTTNNRWYFYSGGAWRNAGP